MASARSGGCSVTFSFLLHFWSKSMVFFFFDKRVGQSNFLIFRSTSYVNDSLPEDSIDIYKRYVIMQYLVILSMEILNELCYISFVKHQLLPKKIEEDSQPIELT